MGGKHLQKKLPTNQEYISYLPNPYANTNPVDSKPVGAVRIARIRIID